MAKLPPVDPDLILAERSRRSLKEFIKSFWHVLEPHQPFQDGWVLDAYCDHLSAIGKDGFHNLLVNVPPGSSKSLVFQCFWFAWSWIQNPSSRFLYASYALPLIERDSERSRRLVQSNLYQKCFGDRVVLAGTDQRLVFENEALGARRAISVGSATKGFKGSHLIIDDPNTGQDARKTTRKSLTCQWFDADFFDRLNDFDKGVRVVVGQRIAKDDLHNHILENYRDLFEVLTIPYDYKPNSYVTCIGWKDPRSKENEPLWPERYPPETIQVYRKKAGTFSAQWNQNPVDTTNALFPESLLLYADDRDTEYRCGERRLEKQNCYRVLSCDLAYSTTAKADYTALVVADCFKSGEIVIVHVYREKITSVKLLPQIQALFNSYKPRFCLIEDNAFQRLLIDNARREGLPVVPVHPKGDKEFRSLDLQIRVEAGQVWFVKDKPWLEYVKQEFVEFPNGRHDDVVDACTMLCIEVNRRTGRTREKKEAAPMTPEESRRREEADRNRALLAGIPGISPWSLYKRYGR